MNANTSAKRDVRSGVTRWLIREIIGALFVAAILFVSSSDLDWAMAWVLVGVYLVFASLIIPALAVRELPDRPALWLGYGLGAAGYALGLVCSALFDLPAGPVIVWTLALLGAGLWAVAARWRA